jgi:hypothetical protein
MCRHFAERRRLSGVRLVCRYVRTGIDRERPTPKIVRRKQGDPSIKSAFENVAAGWVALAEQVERIGREKSPEPDQENNRSVR